MKHHPFPPRTWRPARLPKHTRQTTTAALLCFFLLAGCARLPQSGSVNFAPLDQQAPSHVGLAAEGPTTNATPVQLVRDFLRACAAGFTDDFAVARSYLGSATAYTWQPGAQVQIFATDSSLVFSPQLDGSVMVKGQAVASVDELGHYTVAGPQTQIQASFSMARGADKQWRITSLDNGVILSAAAFLNAYDSAQVNFLSPDGTTLVPALRWFPRRRQITYLARALLQGPDDAVKGAAITAFPAGTTLPAGALDVTEGAVTIPLYLTGATPGPATVGRMYWQMESTLASTGVVSGVHLLAGTVPLAKPDLPQAQPPRPVAIVRKENAVQTLGQGRLTPIGGLTLPAGGPIRSLAQNQDGSVVAYVESQNHLFVSTNRSPARLIYEGTMLTKPSVDRLSWVWVADQNQPGQVSVISPDGSLTQLHPPWLEGERILACRVSADGAKLALLVESGSEVNLRWAYVQRDAQGTPTGINLAGQFGSEKVSFQDLTWAGNTTVLLLSKSSDKPQVYVFPLSGPPTSWPAVPGAVGITAHEDEKNVLVVNQEGDLFQRSGRNWQQIATAVADPAYPG